jgi:GTPase
VPYVGTVVNGIINSGIVKSGDAVLLGPDSNGNYQTTVIKSMQRKRWVSDHWFSQHVKNSALLGWGSEIITPFHPCFNF